MDNIYDSLLTLDEVCEILHAGKNTVYGLLNTQKIQAFKLGNVWKIPRESVIKYIKTSSNLIS